MAWAFSLFLAVAASAQTVSLPEAPSAAGAWSAQYGDIASFGRDFPAFGSEGISPEDWPAALRTLDASGLEPARALSARSAPERAERVREAVSARLNRIQRESDGTELKLETHRRELADMQRCVALLPNSRREELLTHTLRLEGRLHEIKAATAKERIDAARAAWSRGGDDRAFFDELHAAAQDSIVPRTFRGVLAAALETQSEALEAAAWKPDADFLQQPFVHLFLGKRRREVDRLQRAVAEAPDPRLVAGLVPEDPFLVDGLKSYLPEFRPEWAVMGRAEFDLYLPNGRMAGGWAHSFRLGEDGWASFVQVRPAGWLTTVTNTIHESVHQRDRGYDKGKKALALLLGDSLGGGSLASALLEGYTELRARETAYRIFEDGRKGRSRFAFETRRAMMLEFGLEKDPVQAWTEKQPYQSYVKLAARILRRPGGRAVLDAFVERGEVEGLYRLFGLERLEAISRFAVMTESHRHSAVEGSLMRAGGIDKWAAERMLELASGSEIRPITAQLVSMWNFVKTTALQAGKLDRGGRKRVLAALEAQSAFWRSRAAEPNKAAFALVAEAQSWRWRFHPRSLAPLAYGWAGVATFLVERLLHGRIVGAWDMVFVFAAVVGVAMHIARKRTRDDMSSLIG